MKIFFAYTIGLTLYITSLAALSCNNNSDNARQDKDTTVIQQKPSTTPSNDTVSYQRMNDHIPDSAQ